MREVVIVSAVRTPIGAYCGMLLDVPVEKLADHALNGAIKRANVKPEEVDDVIIGQSFQMVNLPTLPIWLSLRQAGQLKFRA